MQNLTGYSDQELSLIFNNDETLYNMARKAGSINELKDIADQFFIYDDEQLAELEQDFMDGSFD